MLFGFRVSPDRFCIILFVPVCFPPDTQHKAVRPDRGADQLLVRFCKFKYIIQHLIVESHRVIRRAVPPDAFVLVIDDLFYNECQQLVFIGEMLIEGRLPDHRPVAQLFDLDVLKGHLLHHFNQCLCHGHIMQSHFCVQFRADFRADFCAFFAMFSQI
mgnify:CR=1 FL=1